MLYEAREKALERVQIDADKCGADEVVGVKTYIYDLGGGLVEFMVIGTAVKKIDGVTTKTPDLLPQAIIRDRDTFVDDVLGASTDLESSKAASASKMQKGPITIIVTIIGVIFYAVSAIFGK